MRTAEEIKSFIDKEIYRTDLKLKYYGLAIDLAKTDEKRKCYEAMYMNYLEQKMTYKKVLNFIEAN